MNTQNNPQFNGLSPNPKIGLAIVISVVITALVVSGGVYWWQKSIAKNIKDEASRTQQILQQQIDGLMTELTGQGEKITEYFFKVYGANNGTTDEEINFYVAIPNNLPLLGKLQQLADRLSRFEFRYLPINVLRIENHNGKKIAIIELNEIGDSYPSSWRGLYFQGSTGGHFTTITLIKTFLQEDYKGDWIDGVEFYYEREPISDDWDHISLNGIMYRREPNLIQK